METKNVIVMLLFKLRKMLMENKLKLKFDSPISRLRISMIIQSCLDNVVNAHVRFAAEIPLPRLSRLIVGMVSTVRGDGRLAFHV